MAGQILLVNRNMEEFNLLRKEERKKRYKSMTSQERQKLILKTMKSQWIEIGSGFPNKIYDNKEVNELINIANCFPELRENSK